MIVMRVVMQLYWDIFPVITMAKSVPVYLNSPYSLCRACFTLAETVETNKNHIRMYQNILFWLLLHKALKYLYSCSLCFSSCIFI